MGTIRVVERNGQHRTGMNHGRMRGTIPTIINIVSITIRTYLYGNVIRTNPNWNIDVEAHTVIKAGLRRLNPEFFVFIHSLNKLLPTLKYIGRRVRKVCHGRRNRDVGCLIRCRVRRKRLNRSTILLNGESCVIDSSL